MIIFSHLISICFKHTGPICREHILLPRGK